MGGNSRNCVSKLKSELMSDTEFFRVILTIAFIVIALWWLFMRKKRY